jgi:cobalt-zinc-cadmium efflux system protein
MAMMPASSQHTYGFRRMKVLAAFINGATLLVVSIEILREAITRFIHPEPVIAGPMLIIAIIGLVANLLVALVLRGHSHGDLNSRAAFLHVLGDALSSVGVIVAGIIMLITGWTWVDPAAGVLIAIVILTGAGRVLKEATHILNEGSPDGVETENVSAELAKIPGIVGVHDLHLWAIEPGYPVMSAHILLEDQNLSDTASIMNKIKEVVSGKFKIDHTTIQFECSSCGQGQVVYESAKKA